MIALLANRARLETGPEPTGSTGRAVHAAMLCPNGTAARPAVRPRHYLWLLQIEHRKQLRLRRRDCRDCRRSTVASSRSPLPPKGRACRPRSLEQGYVWLRRGSLHVPQFNVTLALLGQTLFLRNRTGTTKLGFARQAVGCMLVPGSAFAAHGLSASALLRKAARGRHAVMLHEVRERHTSCWDVHVQSDPRRRHASPQHRPQTRATSRHYQSASCHAVFGQLYVLVQ